MAQESLKLLKERRKVEQDIAKLKKETKDWGDQELRQLQDLENRKKRIAKLEGKAQADRDKAELAYLGVASRVSSLQEEIGKRVERNGRSVFQLSNSFKIASSNMQPMVRGGVQMTDTYQGFASLMDDIAMNAEKAETYLQGGSDNMQSTTSAMSAAIEDLAENAEGYFTAQSGEQFKNDPAVQKEAEVLLEVYTALDSRFKEATTTMGEGFNNINDLQSQSVGLAGEMARSYEKIGTSGFSVSVDKAEELYDQSVRQAKLIKSVTLPDMKKKIKFMLKELELLNPLSNEYTAMQSSIEEMQGDMEEMEAASEAMVATTKRNVKAADQMRVMNNQVAAAAEYINKPFDRLKSTIESLPFGGIVSSMIDLEGLSSSFGDTVQKNLVGMLSEPQVAMEEYTTSAGNTFTRFRDLSTGQLVSADDESVLTLNDMDSAMDNITTGAMDYTTKLADGLKMATKGAWQFVTAALANPYVAVAAAIALIGVLLYKAMSYAEAMRQEFGVTRGEAFEIQTAVDATAMQFKMLGVSAEDVGTMAQGIADNMGGVSNITQENLAAMAELQGLYGMSAGSIAPAMTAMKGLGAESNEAASAQLAQIGHMAQMAGVAPAKVFEDMTANMGTFSRFGKEGGKNLAEAAIMARKLGTSLESMAATSDALLDFESNINDQMEASMLLGRSINMDKARELALAGDMAGQEREILKQIGTQAQWEKMNVVQRDALAKATGKSTEDLSTMLANQANLNAMTSAEREDKEAMQKADEKVNKGMKDMGGQLGELFKSMMEPLKELMVALGPTLGVILKVLSVSLKVAFLPLKLAFGLLNPIIKGIGWLLSNLKVIGMVAASIIFPPFALIAGIGALIYKNWESIVDLIKSMGKMVFTALITPFQMLWSGIKAGFAMWVSLIKAPFNLIIAGVNMVINAINSLSVKVPDWIPLIGGKEFGFNLPNVPSLATEAGGPGHNVKETGVAEVHKGESVGTFDMSQTNSKLDELIQLLGQSGPIATGVGGVKSNTKSISDQIV